MRRPCTRSTTTNPRPPPTPVSPTRCSLTRAAAWLRRLPGSSNAGRRFWSSSAVRSTAEFPPTSPECTGTSQAPRGKRTAASPSSPKDHRPRRQLQLPPHHTVDIELTSPANAPGPVPVIMEFCFEGYQGHPPPPPHPVPRPSGNSREPLGGSRALDFIGAGTIERRWLGRLRGYVLCRSRRRPSLPTPRQARPRHDKLPANRDRPPPGRPRLHAAQRWPHP